MRAHGTRACYVFGPEPGQDRSLGCRCEPCAQSNRDYALVCRWRKNDGDPRAYVDAAEVRQHLRMLRRRGVGIRAVATRSGASRSELQKLANGRRRRVTPALADRVLLVFPIDAADGAYVDATATWRLLDDLLAHGHTRTAIARELGSRAKVPALQVGRRQVTARQARAVRALHARLLVSVLAEREEQRKRRALYRPVREDAA